MMGIPKPPRGVHVTRGPGGRPQVYARSDKTGGEIEAHLTGKLQQYVGLLRYYEEAERIFGFSPNPSDKDSLMRIGEFFRAITYEHTDEDPEAVDKYVEFLDRQPDVFRLTSLVEPDAIINVMAARWADQAFPVVTMGEKYFAALAATHAPTDFLEEIAAPWKCFVVEVPAGLLTLWDPDEQRAVRITRIMVQRFFGPKSTLPGHIPDGGPRNEWGWRYIVFSESGQHIWRGGTAKDLVSPVSFSEREIRHYYDPEREGAFEEQLTHDERLYALLGRLVLNVCVALNESENVRAVGSSHKRWEARKGARRQGPPEQRVFQLGRPIQVDCRAALREYLEGSSKNPREVKVQFLVRGHWRNQAHGPKYSLRRRQWIEPFWKGPEDGPINVRPHVLGRDDE